MPTIVVIGPGDMIDLPPIPQIRCGLASCVASTGLWHQREPDGNGHDRYLFKLRRSTQRNHLLSPVAASTRRISSRSSWVECMGLCNEWPVHAAEVGH